MCTGLHVMEVAAWAVRQLRWHEQQPKEIIMNTAIA